MEYYGNNDYRDYLALRHHGILGMKWGKRNGPPYPLGSGDHSASEEKAGWRKSLGGGNSSAVRSKRRYINKESKRIEKHYNRDIKRTEKAEKKAERKYNKAEEKGSSRVERLEERYRDARVDNEALKRIKEAEIKRIENMTSKDIKDEKKAVKEAKAKQPHKAETIPQLIEESRRNRKSLQELKSENRVTKGERNQIKEDVRKEINSHSKNLSDDDKKAKVESLYTKSEIKTLDKIDRDWFKAYDTWYWAKGTEEQNKKAKATMDKLEAERYKITDAKLDEYFKYLGLNPNDKYVPSPEIVDAQFEFQNYEPVAVNRPAKKKK